MKSNNIIILLYTIFVFTHFSVQANQWQPQLLAAENDAFRSANAAIKIQIPKTISSQQVESLRLEIDDIDVTDMIQKKGRLLVYKPIKPLTAGQHQLRLLEFSEEGDIIERGVWAIVIKKSKHFIESNYTSNIELNSAIIIHDHNTKSNKQNNNHQGAMYFDQTIKTQNWQFNNNITASINSQKAQTANNNSFDLDNYLFTGDSATKNFRLGHHDLGYNNLLMSEFNRRGLSASYKSHNKQKVLTGFIMRSDPLTGFKNGLGISDADNTTRGIIATYAGKKKSGLSYQISSSLIDSRGHNSGEGDGGGLDEQQNQGGKAANLVIDSKSANKHWRVRAEIAGSEFDFDGLGTGFSSENDHAYALQAQYLANPKQTVGKKFNWELSIEHKRIGTFFKSLANSSLPHDRLASQFMLNLNYNNWAINAIAGVETDNTDDDSTLPTVRTNLFNLTASYSPSYIEDKQINNQINKLRLFKNANYIFNYTRSRQKAEDIPLSFTGIQTNNLNDIFTINANFTPDNWSWSASHTITLAVDHSNDLKENQNNSNSYLTELNFLIPINDKINLNPSLQYNIEDNKSSLITTKTLGFSLAANLTISEQLTGALNYTLNQNKTSNHSSDKQVDTIDISINYLMRKANNNKPGITWFIKGNWQIPDDADDSLQILTGLQLGWPVNN